MKRIEKVEEKFDVLEARMDQFTSLEEGSTTGDAELIDGRIGYDGTVYDNIGGAIRKQVGDLKGDIVDYLHIDSDNIFDPSKATKNKYVNSNGEELDASDYELSELISVPFVGDNYLYFNKDAVSSEYSDYKGVHQIILYDSNTSFIKRVACIGALHVGFNQANAKYMRLMIGSNTKDLMVVVSNKYDETFSPTYIPYGGAYTETFKNEVNETLKEYANSEEFKDNIKDNINSVIDKRQENDTERPLEHIIHDGGLTRIFRTAGVVGDSLSSGCMEYKDSSDDALGYARTAWVISSYVDWYIRHNYEEFREVGFIGTDYKYYD